MASRLRFPASLLPDGAVVGGRLVGWPLEGAITQVFGQLSLTGSRHGGVDIGAPAATPIRAPADGLLSRCQSADFGLYVVIDHEDGWYTAYAHLSAYGAPDGPVSAGEEIGRVGDTGLSFGAHLHWALSRDPSFRLDFDNLRDPLEFVNGGAMTPNERDLLHALADILVRNGIDAVATEATLDLFPNGSVLGETTRLAGEAALEYAQRQGLSLALGLTELNTVVGSLRDELRGSRRPRRPQP